jgi:hypothetical protein
MGNNFLSQIDFIYLFITLTWLIGLIWLPKTHFFKTLVLAILCVDFLTETLSNFLMGIDKSIFGLYNVSVLFHHALWLRVLVEKSFFQNLGKKLIWGFLVFGLLNLFFFEGWNGFNFSTFIVGALFYLIGFIVESFQYLQKEDFAFFHQNDFIVLSAPLLFFIGFSMMFGFRNHDLNAYLILGKWELYTVISHMGNIIYYGMILWYVFLERRANHLLKRV